MNTFQTIRTPTGPLRVMTTVATKLLAEGVISGTLDGDLHAADAATVKAAIIGDAGICDFCSAMAATNVFDIPDFEMPTVQGAPMGQSVGGWLACDTCADLIYKDNRKTLLARSLDSLAFSKFTRPAIVELHVRFWRGMDDKATAAGTAAAIGDFVEDRLPARPEGYPTDRDARIEAMMKVVGLTRAEVLAITRGEIDMGAVTKLAKWDKQFYKGGGGDQRQRQILDLLAGPPHKPLPVITPHWQKALDAKLETAKKIERILQETNPSYFEPEPTDLNDPDAVRRLMTRAVAGRNRDVVMLTDNVKALRHAETYSFNAETSQAIMLAAESMPHETTLTAIDTPGAGRAGWFWFAEPIPVRTHPEIATVTALLWNWETKDTTALNANPVNIEPFLTLTAFVNPVDPDPTASWEWHRQDSIHNMVARTTAVYRKNNANNPNAVFGEEATIKGMMELTLFFTAACLWMKERIAVGESGHVERHARKRYVREHKLTEPPSVQVIALRRSYREPAGPKGPGDGGEGKSRQYHWKWVVSGHPRLQACGPGRSDRKLIWIDPYPKGNPDAPLLVRKKVYAVVR